MLVFFNDASEFHFFEVVFEVDGLLFAEFCADRISFFFFFRVVGGELRTAPEGLGCSFFLMALFAKEVGCLLVILDVLWVVIVIELLISL